MPTRTIDILKSVYEYGHSDQEIVRQDFSDGYTRFSIRGSDCKINDMAQFISLFDGAVDLHSVQQYADVLDIWKVVLLSKGQLSCRCPIWLLQYRCKHHIYVEKMLKRLFNNSTSCSDSFLKAQTWSWAWCWTSAKHEKISSSKVNCIARVLQSVVIVAAKTREHFSVSANDLPRDLQ